MKKYLVQKGDCLSGIAWMHGFQRWQTIYEADENEKFRKKRPNPNVIHPADELWIPDKEKKEVDCASEKRHHFKLYRSDWLLRIELRDEILKGLENLPYVLEIPGGVKIEDRTGKDGLVETKVPSWARTGTLRVSGEEIALRLGGLDPVRQVSGVQQRLNNLGFNAGPVDGIVGPKTRRAVAAFQASHPKLKPTGILDDDTLRSLMEVHDNDKRLSDPEENSPPGDDEKNPDLGGTPGEGGWKGDDLTCHPPNQEENASVALDFYFAIYYVDKDGSRAFERAAETWHRKISANAGFSEERYLAVEVKSEEEFTDTWLRIQAETRQKQAWIREGHVFTHGSLTGRETGLEFTPGGGGSATLTRPEIEGLPKLSWHLDGLLVLHSCNSGLDRDGWNPASSFARVQGVRTRGQTGSAFFSQHDDRWVEIDSGSPDVFLRAFYHGRNNLRNPLQGSSDQPMPEFQVSP